jgi:site-specific DNA recombinase
MTPRKRTVRKVAIYARRSKKNAETDVQLQLIACRRRAETEGWKIIDEYADNGVSAYSTRTAKPREGYEALLAAVQAGKVDAVLCYRDDRLFRRDRERLRFQDICDAAGVWKVAYADGADDDLTTAEGQRRFRERGSSAEYYSALLSERMRDHHQMLADAGRDKGGMRPFGFDADRVTIRESEAKMVRDAARRVIAGESLRSICVRWNSEGRTTVAGTPWRPTRIRRMLTAPRYTGLREHNGTTTDAVWGAILDRGTFDLVTAVLEDPERKTTESVARRRLLSGFIYCEACGTRLYSHSTGRKRVYRCMSGPNTEGCGKVSIAADSTDEYVSDRAYNQWELVAAQETAEADPAPDPVDEVAVRLTGIEAKLRDLGRAYAAGDVEMEAFAEASKTLRAQRNELSTKAVRPAKRPQRSWSELYAEALEAKAPWEEGFDPADLEGWRAIIADVIDRVVVRPAAKRGGRFQPERVTIRWR